MSTGKKISELPEATELEQDDVFVIATPAQANKRVTMSRLFESLHGACTVDDAKNREYTAGEVVNIVDFKNPYHIAHGEFMCFCYTQKPTWFNGDIDNALYAVNRSDDRNILINTALSDARSLILKLDEAKQLAHLLNNTGKLFFEPSQKKLCTMINNVVRAVRLKSFQSLEKTGG